MIAIPKFPQLVAGLFVMLASGPSAQAQFYGDPPDETHPWAVHDMNRPQPPLVTPAEKPGDPPSDAVVLFDGTEGALDNWTHEKEKDKRKGDWIVKDGALQCGPGAGYIRSKDEFGDCQLHVEWSAPSEVQGDGQGRGNSGVFLMGMTEVQVLDNYQNETYPDGTAGSVYGVMPPAANALNAPGEWNTYDIIFRRPVEKDGVIYDGAVTVLLNGVVIQDSTALEGGGGHKKRSVLRGFPDKGPLKIQDHGNPVRFRNIWYRPLRPRPFDGGTDGQLSPEATIAKRAEIAAGVREDAARLAGVDKLLRLMESFTYAPDDGTMKEVEKLGEDFIGQLKATPADKMESKKDVTQRVWNAGKYLVDAGRIPADTPLVKEVTAIVKEMGWDKKKK